VNTAPNDLGNAIGVAEIFGQVSLRYSLDLELGIGKVLTLSQFNLSGAYIQDLLDFHFQDSVPWVPPIRMVDLQAGHVNRGDGGGIFFEIFRLPTTIPIPFMSYKCP
jgi:hypothetical protein